MSEALRELIAKVAAKIASVREGAAMTTYHLLVSQLEMYVESWEASPTSLLDRRRVIADVQMAILASKNKLRIVSSKTKERMK